MRRVARPNLTHARRLLPAARKFYYQLHARDPCRDGHLTCVFNNRKKNCGLRDSYVDTIVTCEYSLEENGPRCLCISFNGYNLLVFEEWMPAVARSSSSEGQDQISWDLAIEKAFSHRRFVKEAIRLVLTIGEVDVDELFEH